MTTSASSTKQAIENYLLDTFNAERYYPFPKLHSQIAEGDCSKPAHDLFVHLLLAQPHFSLRLLRDHHRL